MKLLVAILAVLALVGSAMAWELSDELQYTYVKAGWQEAGDSFILPAMVGATSNAHFYDPCVEVDAAQTAADDYYGTDPTKTGVIPASAATVQNTLGSATVDRIVYNPPADLTNTDFSAQLTQGGSAQVALHSQIDDAAAKLAYQNFGKVDTPEMMGTASAYQNLNVAGGFDRADASFDSAATVGVDSIFAHTIAVSSPIADTQSMMGDGLPANLAYVDSGEMGGGVIESANLGEQVTADIVKSWPGTGWATPEYSGGIKMWADFTACDPGCSNPIEASVSGKSWTSIFPGTAQDTYWGVGSQAALTPFKP
jgi:hypothetical protein